LLQHWMPIFVNYFDMKYFVYCRKSTEGDDKQALSLPAQFRELTEFSRLNKYQIVEIYQEKKSARIPKKRPQFDEMLERIRKGEAGGIIVWHTNRLSRNPEESGVLMQMLNDGLIKEIRTPQQTIDGSCANDILLGVEFGSNSQFSKDLSINTRRGIREKVIMGQYPSFAPAFYLNYGKSKKDKNIQPDPETAHFYPKLVDEVISKRLNTDKAVALLAEWGVTNRFGRKFARNTVYRLLRNPVYYGVIKYSNYPERKGCFESLISESKWRELQDVLADKAKPVQIRREYAFTRMISCGKCGLSVTGITKEKQSGIYRYYGCTKRHGNCGNNPITEYDLEKQFKLALQQIRMNQETVSKLKTRTLELLDDEFKRESERNHQLLIKLEEANRRQNKILEMRLEGELDKDQFLDLKEKGKIEIQRLTELQNDSRFNREEVRNQLELFFEKLFDLQNVFDNGTYEEKHLLMQTILTDLTLEDGQLRWNFKKPYDSLVLVDPGLKNFKWGGWRDLNPQPPVPQTGALTN